MDDSRQEGSRAPKGWDPTVKGILKGQDSQGHMPTGVTWDEGNIEEYQAYLQSIPPRMRVDEPKTPYHTYTDPEEEEGSGVPPCLSLNDVKSTTNSHSAASASDLYAPTVAMSLQSTSLQLKLDMAKGEEEKDEEDNKTEEEEEEGDVMAEGPPDEFEEEEEEEEEEESRRGAFEAKRKEHYNEYEMLKAWRMRHSAEEEDDEEDG